MVEVMEVGADQKEEPCVPCPIVRKETTCQGILRCIRDKDIKGVREKVMSIDRSDFRSFWNRVVNLRREQYLVIGLAGFLAFYLMIGYGADFLCNLIGFLYPAYASVKAIESKGKDDDTKWLTYWVVYSGFALVEFFGDIFLFWVPLYWFFKCLFLLYCMIPGDYNGSLKIYGSIIRPFFLKHQSKVDKALDEAGSVIGDIASDVFGMSKKAKEAAGEAAAEVIAANLVDSSKSD